MEGRVETVADRGVADAGNADTAGIRVFVYGTLKEGHGNHPALASAEFLGTHVVEGGYKMYNMGYFPGVVRDADSTDSLHGEVYLVDEPTLQHLDFIEGHPNFYERTKISTPWKRAWVYLLRPEDVEGQPVIPLGDWRDEHYGQI